jgi:hypothetical protein
MAALEDVEQAIAHPRIERIVKPTVTNRRKNSVAISKLVNAKCLIFNTNDEQPEMLSLVTCANLMK